MTIVRRAVQTAVKQITAWSFSRWGDYKKCPALARYKHVDKLKEPDNQYSDRGNQVHSAADDFIEGKVKSLLPDFKHFKKEMTALRRVGALTKQDWAFNAAWEPVGWFAPEAWVRIKVDTHYLESKKVQVPSGLRAYNQAKKTLVQTTVVIIDFKTGKVYEDEHRGQRSLYALGAMLMYPDVVDVIVQHWYLDNGAIHETRYAAADLDELKQLWVTQTRPMLRDRVFKPTPGRQCAWCFFSKNKGGPCAY